MAAVAKVGVPSVSSVPNDPAHKLSNRLAGEQINPCDACQVAADGQIYRATTRVDGFYMGKMPCPQGDPCTLSIVKMRYRYGKQGTVAPDVVPGKLYYLSDTVPGGIDDTVTTGNTAPKTPIALGLDNGVLQTQPSY